MRLEFESWSQDKVKRLVCAQARGASVCFLHKHVSLAGVDEAGQLEMSSELQHKDHINTKH